MSYELRLKQMKKSWMEIQSLREERNKQRLIGKEANKEVKRISQLIPKKLDEYNSTMV